MHARCGRRSHFILIAFATFSISMSDASAERSRSSPAARTAQKPKKVRTSASCLRALDQLGVRYKRIERKGIAIGVRVVGSIDGIEYRGYQKKSLDLDCSLVVTLALMAPHLKAHGIRRATYSSAYQRRKVRGSDRWSRHSFGLALDIHEFSGDEPGLLRVKDDYEQGLGDHKDCIGQPLTRGGKILRTLHCRFEQSGRFHSILTPDYDAGHYNHFHLEVLPWSQRTD